MGENNIQLHNDFLFAMLVKCQTGSLPPPQPACTRVGVVSCGEPARVSLLSCISGECGASIGLAWMVIQQSYLVSQARVHHFSHFTSFFINQMGVVDRLHMHSAIKALAFAALAGKELKVWIQGVV